MQLVHLRVFVRERLPQRVELPAQPRGVVAPRRLHDADALLLLVPRDCLLQRLAAALLLAEAPSKRGDL